MINMGINKRAPRKLTAEERDGRCLEFSILDNSKIHSACTPILGHSAHRIEQDLIFRRN